MRPGIETPDVVTWSSFAGNLAVQRGAVRDLPSVPGDGALSEPVKVVGKVSGVDREPVGRWGIGIRVGDLDGTSTERQEEPRIVSKGGIIRVIETLGDPGVLVQDPVPLQLEDDPQSGSVRSSSVVDRVLSVLAEIVLENAPHPVCVSTLEHVLEPREQDLLRSTPTTRESPVGGRGDLVDQIHTHGQVDPGLNRS